MKKIIAILLAAVMLSSMVAGCGQKAAEAPAAAAPAAEAPAAEAPAAEGTTGKIHMYVSQELAETWEKLNARFMEQNPGIEVELETAEPDSVTTVLKTKVASGEIPDIMQVWQHSYGGLTDAGALLDITDKEYTKRLNKTSQDAFTYSDGRIYADCMSNCYVGVMYNRDFFAANGIEVPETWDEFLAVCQKCKDAGAEALALPYAELYAAVYYMRAAMSSLYAKNPNFDAQIESGETTYVDDPDFRDIIDKYILLKDKEYFLKDALGVSAEQAMMMFASGEAAMYINGSWDTNATLALNPDLNMGMFPLPLYNEKELNRSCFSPEFGLAVSASSEYPEAVDLYMNFITDGDNYLELVTANGGVSTVEGLSVQGVGDMYTAMDNTPSNPFMKFFGDSMDAFNKACQEIFMGNSADDALAQYQAIVDEALGR